MGGRVSADAGRDGSLRDVAGLVVQVRAPTGLLASDLPCQLDSVGLRLILVSNQRCEVLGICSNI